MVQSHLRGHAAPDAHDVTHRIAARSGRTARHIICKSTTTSIKYPDMKLLLLSAVAGFLAFAQQAPPKLQVSDVLEMAQGGLPEDLVIAKLRKDKVAFDLSPQDMVKLKKAGVSDNIIKVMLDPSAAV